MPCINKIIKHLKLKKFPCFLCIFHCDQCRCDESDGKLLLLLISNFQTLMKPLCNKLFQNTPSSTVDGALFWRSMNCKLIVLLSSSSIQMRYRWKHRFERFWGEPSTVLDAVFWKSSLQSGFIRVWFIMLVPESSV